MARGGASTALVSDTDGHLVGIWTAASALGLLGSAHAGPRPPGLARPVGHVKKTVPVAAGETRIDSLVTDIIATPGGTTIVLDSLYRPLGTVGHPEICHLGCVAPSARPRTLGALASPGAVRVDADTPLSEVTGMFTRHRCEWMLVCEGASFVGIVRADELLRRLWGGESPQ
jgi:hypothetical protein